MKRKLAVSICIILAMVVALSSMGLAFTSTAVKSLSLTSPSLVLAVGESYTLTATILPENASNKSVGWSSSNTSIAKVNAKGQLSAQRTGTAVITSKSADGKASAKCSVVVKKASAITKLTIWSQNYASQRQLDQQESKRNESMVRG